MYVENTHATPLHLDVFWDLGAMGKCWVLCDFCVWASRLVAAWLLFGSCRDHFCFPGRPFESFVSLCCEPGGPGAPHGQTFEKTRKMKELGSSIGRFSGHILRPLRPKVEPSSVLLRSLVSLFPKAFLAAFRSGLLKEIVESRRFQMCVTYVSARSTLPPQSALLP